MTYRDKHPAPCCRNHFKQIAF